MKERRTKKTRRGPVHHPHANRPHFGHLFLLDEGEADVKDMTSTCPSSSCLSSSFSSFCSLDEGEEDEKDMTSTCPSPHADRPNFRHFFV
jgi:hypothetical protein